MKQRTRTSPPRPFVIFALWIGRNLAHSIRIERLILYGRKTDGAGVTNRNRLDSLVTGTWKKDDGCCD